MNATREEVYAITNALDESLHITHEEALDLARFSDMQDLRDQAHEALTIHEAIPPSLDRYLSTGDENGLEQMQRIDNDRIRRLRPYVWALCILGCLTFWTAVIAGIMAWRGML